MMRPDYHADEVKIRARRARLIFSGQQIPCEDIYELPMISKMNYDSFNMLYKLIYGQSDPAIEQSGFSQQTMQIKVTDASSLQQFLFSVNFDGSYVFTEFPSIFFSFSIPPLIQQS